MEILTFSLGQLSTNTYLVINGNECLIIDPANDATFISDKILERRLTPRAILLTHGHFDHCLACLELNLTFNIPVYLDTKDMPLYKKAHLSAKHWTGQKALVQPPTLPYPAKLFGFTVIPTPGHTPGSVSLYSPGALFTGDTLFSDAVGSTDHAYSSKKDLEKSLKALHDLPGITTIYPGHADAEILQNALLAIKKGRSISTPAQAQIPTSKADLGMLFPAFAGSSSHLAYRSPRSPRSEGEGEAGT